MDSLSTFDLIVNQKGEILIILFENNNKKENITFSFNKIEKWIKISYNEENFIFFKNVHIRLLNLIDRVNEINVLEIGIEDVGKVVSEYKMFLKK